ncbi:MAG: glycine zipper family protein [Pseudomonadota bacterium]
MTHRTLTRIGLVPAGLALVLLTGCAGLSDTEQRAVTGTAAGAAGGAVVGAIAGNAALGAAIGAGAGLVGGLVVDKVQKDKDAAYQQGVQDGRSSN